MNRPIPPTRSRPTCSSPSGNLVMGHEFCCEVVELGPSVNNLAVGDVVVSMPVTFDASGFHAIGFSNTYPGGYAGADGAQRDAGDQGARRAPPSDGGPHRTARRRRPRGGEVEDRPRRGGRRDRARARRAGVYRGDEDARYRPDHRRRISPRRAARWPSISVATRSSILRSRHRSRRGDGSMATSRS